jgi:3-isopropylmalate/(R)-2-methylmalate dehydratase large subunit
VGLTIAEKILAAHTDASDPRAGDIIKVRLDVALANDITAPIAINEFERGGFTAVHDPMTDRVDLLDIFDHPMIG